MGYGMVLRPELISRRREDPKPRGKRCAVRIRRPTPLMRYQRAMSDIGKFGKVKGDLHPKHARRIDAAPPRATPKMVRRPKAQKCFGFSYEWESLVFRKLPEGGSRSYGRKWVTEECWYETREQRDQALKAHEHKHDRRFYRNYRPIERTAVRVSAEQRGD